MVLNVVFVLRLRRAGRDVALVPCPGVTKPEFGHNLRKAVWKISTPISIEAARPRIHNGNPIMLRRSVNSEPEFSRPPIGSALIDKGDQFLSRFLGPIAGVHENCH